MTDITDQLSAMRDDLLAMSKRHGPDTAIGMARDYVPEIQGVNLFRA